MHTFRIKPIPLTPNHKNIKNVKNSPTILAETRNIYVDITAILWKSFTNDRKT